MDKQIVVNHRSSFSPRDFLTLIFKYKRQMLLIFIFIFSLIGITVSRLPILYEAKSTVLLKMGREYLNRTDLTSNNQLMSLSPAEVTNSEIQILTNRDSIKRVIQSLKIERMYPAIAHAPRSNVDPLESAAMQFEKSLTVQAIKQSNVLEISYKHEDAEVAAEAVNLLVDYFKEKHLQVFSGTKPAFVEMQLAAYERKLRQSEKKLQDFKQQNKVFSLEEQRTLLLKQRSELDSSLKSTAALLRELEDKVPSLRQRLKEIASSRTPHSQPEREKIIEDAKGKLLSMQLEEQQLLKKYTETSPFVTNFRKEMQIVKSFIKQQEGEMNSRTNLGNAVYQSVQMDLIKAETDLRSQKGRAVALLEQLRACDREIQSLDRNDKMVQELIREKTLNEKSYETYLGKVEEARVSESMDRLKLANISVIQEATPPVEPVEPKRAAFIARGALLGLVAALGFAFMSEYLGRGMATPEAAERRLGLKVLAVISRQEG